MSEVKNKVYYNCEDIDASGISYGEDNYDYVSSCEVWRIIGLFDVDNGKGKFEKRLKLINIVSTFRASWDSSDGSSSDPIACGGVNCGYGINQWGESTYEDGSFYEGADLMRFLNGYYIDKDDEECVYCNNLSQGICEKTCDENKLKKSKMKPLSFVARNMIENAVWYTYAVKNPADGVTDSSFSSAAYLEEKGISHQYNAKSEWETNQSEYFNDNVIRTTSWTGVVGLMSVSDITYADGWLFRVDDPVYPMSITPSIYNDVWVACSDDACSSEIGISRPVNPSVYLSSNIQIIGGDGNTEPYILK